VTVGGVPTGRIRGGAVPQITVITEEAVWVDAAPDAARDAFLVEEGRLTDALGWTLKPSGLCRDDVCVPVRDPAALRAGDRIDLTAVARALGRDSVVDLPAGIMAVSLPAEQRRQALRDLRAPDFELRDLDGGLHALSDWRGTKRLLVTFSSWCGCRYDLPGWQALQDELADGGFTVIAVAIDNSPEDVRPFTEGITLPVLYDPQHLLTELYAISNVPTVVWIDEEDRIVRPNGEAFSSDLFREITGVDSGPHSDAVRRWVREGVVPELDRPAGEVVGDLSDDEVRARLHFRVATEALRRGDQATTRAHLDEAGRLAPDDLTIWRAAMPLIGEDPFGADFYVRYEAWRAAGSPFHGMPALADSDAEATSA
jgi:peroxiredoxin